jgi:hypothetical protein
MHFFNFTICCIPMVVNLWIFVGDCAWFACDDITITLWTFQPFWLLATPCTLFKTVITLSCNAFGCILIPLSFGGTQWLLTYKTLIPLSFGGTQWLLTYETFAGDCAWFSCEDTTITFWPLQQLATPCTLFETVKMLSLNVDRWTQWL